MIALGSIVTDKVTGLTGMVTHLQVDMAGQRHMLFQPRGLNPKTGQPVKRHWLVESRLKGGKQVEEPKLPIEALGTEVEDLASGFKGTAVSLQLHISGCVHLEVQPKGMLKEDGAAVETVDFDIRRLKGKAIPKMTEEQREVEQKAKPSPVDVKCYRPAMPC